MSVTKHPTALEAETWVAQSRGSGLTPNLKATLLLLLLPPLLLLLLLLLLVLDLLLLLLLGLRVSLRLGLSRRRSKQRPG